MRFLVKSKKAQGSNYLAVVIVLMMFGFFSILGYTIWIYVVDALTTGGFYVGEVAVTMDNFTRGFMAADYVIVLLMVIMIIGIGLTSYKLSTSGAFFIITIIMGLFWGFVSYIFNYVFILMVSPEVFSTAIGVFPRTMALCTNLHWIALACIVVGSITLYAKKEKGQYIEGT